MIRCRTCGRPPRDITDAQSGLLIKEPGWALVNYSHMCPECKDRLIFLNKIENDKNHQKWLESKKGETNGE